MPYRKILAAIQDAPDGADVLKAGSEIAAAARAELVALRLVDDPWPYIEPGDVETKRAFRDNAWHRVAEARVTDQLLELASQATVATVDVTAAVEFGPPRDAIARAAETEHADLVILGRPPVGASPTPRTWALDGTLRGARVPCLIVPPGPHAWRRFVVLSDGTVATGTVLHKAFGLAALFRSDVVVIEMAPDIERDSRKAFALWAALPGTGTFDVVSLSGDPAQKALDAARAEYADVIVVGYPRGQGIADQSVTARIVRGAPCAVLAIPT